MSLVVAAAGGAVLAALVAVAVYDPRRVAVPQDSPVIVNLARFPARPIIPDLDAAGVSLTGIAFDADGETPLVSATYRGPGGCRMSFYARPADAPPVGPGGPGSDRTSWQVGQISYALIAFGMAPARFAAISRAAEQATRKVKLNAPMVRQLHDLRQTMPECGP